MARYLRVKAIPIGNLKKAIAICFKTCSLLAGCYTSCMIGPLDLPLVNNYSPVILPSLRTLVNTSGVLMPAAGINVRLIFSLPIHSLTVVNVLNVGEALCALAGPDFLI